MVDQFAITRSDYRIAQMAGDKQKKKGSHLIAGGTIVRVGVLVLLMAAVLYRPLPDKVR